MVYKVEAVYNSRKPNGDVSDVVCDICTKVGAAYIELLTTVAYRTHDLHKTRICKGCLSNWDKLINEVIMEDIMASVERRKEKLKS